MCVTAEHVVDGVVMATVSAETRRRTTFDCAERGGHTESTVALCLAAGLPPVGVCCEVMNPDGTMAGAGWLRPGGHLAYSVEHPICTARDPMTGWITAGEGTVWPVDDYARETPRAQQWLGTVVIKHHRRLATLIGGVLAAGLIRTGIDEPSPDKRSLGRRPDLAEHRRRPLLRLFFLSIYHSDLGDVGLIDLSA